MTDLVTKPPRLRARKDHQAGVLVHVFTSVWRGPGRGPACVCNTAASGSTRGRRSSTLMAGGKAAQGVVPGSQNTRKARCIRIGEAKQVCGSVFEVSLEGGSTDPRQDGDATRASSPFFIINFRCDGSAACRAAVGQAADPGQFEAFPGALRRTGDDRRSAPTRVIAVPLCTSPSKQQGEHGRR